MRILIVVGARPNFMKAAPIIRAAQGVGVEPILVHTGQHYDVNMSDRFFSDLGLPRPGHHLGVGAGTHAEQTANVMLRIEPVLREVKPTWLVVVGDVNSTLAAALVGSKLKYEWGMRIAHVEAGLRSENWAMPEEVNRVLTDRLSDLLLTPSRDAGENLRKEGIPSERIEFVGNIMIDTLFHQLPEAKSIRQAEGLGLSDGGYFLTTLHRPSNVDRPDSLEPILRGLNRLAAEFPVVFPAHPRTAEKIREFNLKEVVRRVMVIPPVGYREMLSLMWTARAVLTDSGGIQEETTALGIPCVTLREQTERPLTISEGTNRLLPWPPTEDRIYEAGISAGAENDSQVPPPRPELWDGMTAPRIVSSLIRVSDGG